MATWATLAALATLPVAVAATPAASSPATTAATPGTALGDLQAFLQQTQQGRSAFTQTVTGPRPAPAPDALAAAAAPAARVQISHGVFEFQRPNRFRFHYQRPFEQLIVADGQTLWLYDPDLAQVTARAQREVLGQTPAALLASGADLRTLQQAFSLSNAPDADGLRWVQALPKGADAPLQAVRIGFRGGPVGGARDSGPLRPALAHRLRAARHPKRVPARPLQLQRAARCGADPARMKPRPL